MNRRLFETVLIDPEMQSLLEDIGVKECDRVDLFDVLDANGSGQVELTELVRGLLKLRAEARKSDVVASQLMLREIRRKLNTLSFSVLCNQEDIKRAQRE